MTTIASRGSWLQPNLGPRVQTLLTHASGPDGYGFNLGRNQAPRRDAFAQLIATAHAPRWLQQIHGTHVANLDDPGCLTEGVDACFSRTAGLPCAVLSADCLPVLLAATDGSVVAAAHAGWRGLCAGVIETTVTAMAHPGELRAYLGPCIGPAAFEVGPDVRAAFLDIHPADSDHFVAQRSDRYMADLHGLARRRLRDLGIHQVDAASACTWHDPRYFSYRRQGSAAGRQASLIWID